MTVTTLLGENQKQIECLSKRNCLKKSWYIHMIEQYVSMKNDAIEEHLKVENNICILKRWLQMHYPIVKKKTKNIYTNKKNPTKILTVVITNY